MPEQQQHQPLLSSQTSVNMGPDGGDSTKRALKVAGITVLACALIAGQALTAYFLLSQKSQINALEDSANSLKKEMVHRQSGSSAGMAMHLPMSSMSIMTDDTSEDPKPKDEPSDWGSASTTASLKVPLNHLATFFHAAAWGSQFVEISSTEKFSSSCSTRRV
ncbi:CD74 molecule, major histocompatibility complex, class II invariant chain b isoform X2 [Anguilla rostrata]|uniref:CD74 molecule, major histocompatibility complex, class II invariant chain b isoform X2 n=1 Tax=Anguilla rostrata TaxID=7938 RepID=UPI0030D26AE4